eukprot:m.684338 g.684338  ORF g.684338 m.684338 type:complete len:164 (+) comp22833_c2_seq20:306-797(+)
MDQEFGRSMGPSDWGFSYALLIAALAVLYLTFILSCIDQFDFKDHVYGICDDGIEITGRLGGLCNIGAWVCILLALLSNEWIFTDTFGTAAVTQYELQNVSKASWGLFKWCIEENSTISCMAYDQDPWGSTRQYSGMQNNMFDFCCCVTRPHSIGCVSCIHSR